MSTTMMPPNEDQQAKNRFPDTQNVVSFFLSALDKIAAPETRRRAYSAVFRFCYHRPVLSSFLAVQVLFALLPLICFIGFSICAILFFTSLALGISVFWVGIAAVILFWTLVITFTLAATTWLYLAFCLTTIRYIGRVTGYIETPPKPSQSKIATSQTGNRQNKETPLANGTTSEEYQPVKKEPDSISNGGPPS
ncbi:hypothetical protein H072_11237 [Dactylellina haptotyla CBS 200.50]|uniref:Uncharacterized protein n=1 Tax=Dactylellina haptotyla (strain CBS 200.50) TaxID=1284197 RepID=S7ZXE3_DACHA|nr:hypothetical protein H072_11237 [Dactylellina haptotyla CBS 200.50]